LFNFNSIFMSKKTIFTVVLQVVIIGAFVLIAAGSGSQRSAVSSSAASSFVRSFGQGYACGSAGYRMIGSASSESKCITMCDNAGYSSYCYGDEGGCFCK
jgi:hypothetical protein